MKTNPEETSATASMTLATPVTIIHEPARYPGDKAHWTVSSQMLNIYTTDTSLDSAIGRFVEAVEGKVSGVGGKAFSEGVRLAYFMSLRRQVLEHPDLAAIHEAKPWWEAALTPTPPSAPSLGSSVLEPAVWPGYYAAKTAQALADATTARDAAAAQDDAKDDLDDYAASSGKRDEETLTLADVRAMLLAADASRVFCLDYVDQCLGAATLAHRHPAAVTAEWDNKDGTYQVTPGGTYYRVRGPEIGGFLDWLDDQNITTLTAEVALALLSVYERGHGAEAVKAANALFLTNAGYNGWFQEGGDK